MAGGERIWAAQGDAMSPQETTRQIEQLWRTTDALKSDIKDVRAEQVKQGLTLTEIRADTRAIALAVSNPANRCVQADMRIKSVEDDVAALKAVKCCEDCPNSKDVAGLVDFRKRWEPRLWMGFGIVVFLQVALTVGSKLIK